MRKLSYALFTALSLMLLFSCEQEETLTPNEDLATTDLLPNDAKVSSTEAMTPEVLEQFTLNNEGDDLESRSGRVKLAEYQKSIGQGEWDYFYFHKNNLDRDYKYIAVVTPIHGNPDLYIHGRSASGNWRLVRYSIRNGGTDETYGRYIDLHSHEDRLYFNVFGKTAATYKITFYKERIGGGGNGDCNCTQQYDPVVGCDGKTYSNACFARCAGEYCFDYGNGRPYLQFVTPNNGAHFGVGKDLYVKVSASDHDGIAFVKLYVNNHFVRKESNAPYEWGKPHASNDHKLNNLQAGTYKIVAVAVDRHGNQTVKSITITVGNGGGCYCSAVYDPVVGCDGKTYSNACEARCAGEYCENIGHGPSLHFVTPANHSTFYRGKNLYVKVSASDHDGVAFVKLYINNQFVRKESRSPYEWGKPYTSNDHPLNNLQPGSYTLKAVAVDNRGDQTVKVLRFTVRH